MSRDAEAGPAPYLHYAIAGFVLGAVAFLIGDALGEDQDHTAAATRFRMATSFAVGGMIAGLVHRRLWPLRTGGRIRAYLRWIASSTAGAAVIGIDEFIGDPSIGSLAPVPFFGLIGGIALAFLEGYLRELAD